MGRTLECGSGGRVQVVRWIGLASLLTWLALQWFVRRPDAIVDDFTGWRSADTQTIARYFWRDGIDLSHPRIAWGGDGPGYVESELQIYPALIALFAQVFGFEEWIGQALSLACVALAYVVLFTELSRRFGSGAALAGCMLLLYSKGPTGHATSVQPDSLAFLFFVVGWVSFLKFQQTHTKGLWLTACATSLAALIKPTTLALGLAQFIVALKKDRRLLRRPALWVTWGVVLAVTGAYLLFARELFLEYGNTFGVLSGGDSKTPGLRHLLMPSLWVGALRTLVIWGTGIPAALAGLWLAARCKLEAEESAMGIAMLALLLVSLRYTSHIAWGNHYVMIAGVLGAWLLAHAFHEAKQSLQWGRLGDVVVAAAVLLISTAQYAHATYRILTMPPEAEAALGRELSRHVKPGELIVVRARSMSYDDFWSTQNNFEDPRLFYLADVRGWVLANDQTGTDLLLKYWRRGARYYAEPADDNHEYADVARYLSARAQLVFEGEAGRIWHLPQLSDSPVNRTSM